MRGMLAAMTWGQFCEWVAYSALDPFGEERADYRSAQIVSMIANVNRDPKKGRAFTPEDFMPQFGERVPEPKTANDPAKWDRLTEQMKTMLAGTVVPRS